MDKQNGAFNWEALERLDWHLWVLTILLIFVLGISLLSFMFPSAFWVGSDLALQTPQRAFFGFCVLLALVLVYLVQRQATVRRLKRELFNAQAAVTAAEQETATQAFLGLPGIAQFRDALAMEYRRASSSQAALAAVVFTAPKASPYALGRLTHLLRGILRRGESLYRISDKAVSVILPGMKLGDAASFAAQAETLSEIAREELETRVTSYPEDAPSLAELEGRLHGGRKYS
ncbi:MAG: hypothetical protein HY648_02790 [Acidobacteria bacterium]|nr:hypothetical protein [Acidobacteriota bacterium]